MTTLEHQLLAARQTARVLLAETHQAQARVRDSTLQSASAHVAPIPQMRYVRQYAALTGHRDRIAQFRWSPDLRRIVLACQDGFLIVWDAASGLKVKAVPLASPWVLLCAYLPLGRLVALAGLDNRCTVYSVDDPARRRTTRPHAAYVSAVLFLADEQVLTALGDMTMAQWDVARGTRSRVFVGHVGDVLLVLAADSVLLCGLDGTVRVWDPRVEQAVAVFAVLRRDVNTVAHYPGYGFVCGLDDGHLRLFDLRSECELQHYSLMAQFERLPEPLPVLATYDATGVVLVDVSALGRIIYACYAEYGCIAWDALKNQIVESIGIGGGASRGSISQVAVSPDGQGLATLLWDSVIKVWLT